MKGSNIIWIVLGGLLLVVLLWFGFKGSNEEPEAEYYDWDTSNAFDPYDRNPYGTFILKELMDTGFVNVQLKLIKSHIDLSELKYKEDAVYLFIGSRNYLSDDQIYNLLEFVENGNTALLSFHSIPTTLEFSLFEEGMEIEYFENVAKPVNLKIQDNPTHKIPFIYDNDTVTSNWRYFNKTEFFQTFDVLGKVNEKPDVIEFSYGKGKFILHVNPYVFTNISIYEEEGLEYVEELFSNIPKGDVYWDIYSTTDNSLTYNEEHSPIEFILNNTPLRWAFVSLLIGVLIFGIFAAKRYFKAIPVVKPNDNTSMEFVETISRLYRTRGSNHNLIKIKLESFKNFVSHHYFIPAKKLDEDFIFRLSQKTNLPEENLQKLIKKLQFGAKSDVSNEYLIETHKMLDDFYQNATGVKRKIEKPISIRELDLKLMRKSTVPLSIIGAGFIFVFLGVIMMTLGSDLGPILLILGMISAISGYLIFSTPIIRIKEGELSYQPLVKKFRFDLHQLQSTQFDSEQGIFTLVGSKTEMKMMMRELSQKDQNRLINAIRNLKT